MEVEVMDLEWLDDQAECPVDKLAQQSRFLEVEILDLMHCGAIPLHQGHALSTVRMAARLRRDFELDLQGVALALTLLQRIEELKLEIARLKMT